MNSPRHESHDDTVVEMLKAYPDLANEYLAIALMALRLEAWLGVERGGYARVWIAQQNAYDMWQADQRFKAAPTRVQPAPAMA